MTYKKGGVRAITLGAWTEQRGDSIVYVSASLFGNHVRLYEHQETPRGLGMDRVTMPADVLLEFATRADGAPIFDERQRSLL